MVKKFEETASQIWLAGLGAFARAQAEGGKVFESLVREGSTLQKKTQASAEEKFGEVAGKVSALAGDVQAKYGPQWDKLESMFEERTARAMNKLGVPSAKDVEALAARVDELSARLDELTRRPPRRRTAAASDGDGGADVGPAGGRMPPGDPADG